MTAEVIVLNREAIAIAADSAVSLGRAAQKVYNSANKLFELSIAEPIGIMVYGTASFGPIPWETVIKQYRIRLGRTTFDTVDGYAADFIDHLDDLVEHHPQDLQLAVAEQAVMFELEQAVEGLQREVNRRKRLKQVFQHADKASVLADRVSTRLAELRSQECLQPVDHLTAAALVEELFPDWIDTLRTCFRQIDEFSIANEQAEVLWPLATASLRSVSMESGSSGIVVAGFGKTQIYPAWTSYGVDAVVADRVRARHLERFKIGPEHPVDIRAFAQDDMVLTFLNGVHPFYPDALKGFVIQILDGFIRELRSAAEEADIIDQLEEYMSRVEDARRTANDEFHGELEELLASTHKRPTMSIVSLLPKDELAEFAETLVSLTSFKRRMTPSQETVGGPIDVAVISKGDGLVWVKRKHYFDRKLNLRYFERNRLYLDDTFS